jgi:hypothetical protein
MSKRMTMEQRGKLARDVFKKTYQAWDSFSQCRVGADLAYLLGAILDDSDSQDSFVDWDLTGKPELYRILRQAFDSEHPIWKFIITDK